MKKSKHFLKTGNTTKGDEATIKRVAIDFINSYKKLNQNMVELNPAILDSEIERINKWVNHLRGKVPLTFSKHLEIKWDIIIELKKLEYLEELKQSVLKMNNHKTETR